MPPHQILALRNMKNTDKAKVQAQTFGTCKRVRQDRTVARKSSVRGLDILKMIKLHWFIVFHISIWGLGDLLGGAKPTKAPSAVTTGLTQGRP